MIGYKLRRPGNAIWMYCGTTPKQVARCVGDEIDANIGMEPEEMGKIYIEPFHVTQEEIDSMPEFGGW